MDGTEDENLDPVVPSRTGDTGTAPAPRGPASATATPTTTSVAATGAREPPGVDLRQPGAAVRAPGGAIVAWLRASRLGLVAMALVVGVVAGFGAVGFRWLIFAFTWLATGHDQFGQQGRIPSIHLPWLGIWFLLLIPVIGGLLYGPLIQRFAREARGHGVPEVMVAVAENGGRIRPPVTVVKALASAICIGFGGSVGREGPIVQIGSAFASSLGQLVRMSETRLRVIVACGAAGGIAATFNAPITGMFFGFEIILREFSLDALFATILSAVAADLVSRSFFGAAPFFAGFPHHLVVSHDYTYLLVAVLGLAAGLVGVGFKTVLYKMEDVFDAIWRGRPEWARPAVGGLALGALLLLLPQLYGVGYPVMDRAVGSRIVLWLLVVLMVGKVAAASLTLSIGGSGGVFAPSLFTGAMGGMAFGLVVRDLFGPVVSSPAIFAVVAMGAVFAAATQAPLTAIASVVEMTGNFDLIVPVMLAVGVAVALSKRLTYGNIYTTKLLRRGVDIERPSVTNVLQLLTVGEVMLPVPHATATPHLVGHPVDGTAAGRQSAPGTTGDGPSSVGRTGDGQPGGGGNIRARPRPIGLEALAMLGTVTEIGAPQVLFEDEKLDQALRQLVLYGRVGLPVVSPDADHLLGWVTRHNVLRVLADRLGSAKREAETGRLATEFSEADAQAQLHIPRTPLEGYETVEVSIKPSSPLIGQRLGEVAWPTGSHVVAVTERNEIVPARDDAELGSGERVILLVPAAFPGRRTAPPSDQADAEVASSLTPSEP